MEDKRSYYSVIPASVRYDNRITPNAKLLYGEITALCNEKGFCWATNDYFARLYGVSKTSVSIWISSLIENGYLESTIQYKEGTKEILHRYLKILNGGIKENLNTPVEENLNTPIKENLKENNTVSNNTVTNNTINNLIDSKESICQTEVRRCIDLWNSLSKYGIPPVTKLTSTSTRAKNLRARLREYSMQDYEKAIANIRNSEYLQGKKGDVSWFTFDWFVKPNNFPKVLDGNYSKKQSAMTSKYSGITFE